MFRTGYKTIEFWVTLLAAVGVFGAGLQGAIPAQYSVYLTTAIAVAYAASRALTKWGTDLKQGYQTSEFWIAGLTVVLTLAQTVQSNVPDKTVALSVTVLTAAIAFARALSKPTALADKFHPALLGNGYAGLKDDNPDWHLDLGDAKDEVPTVPTEVVVQPLVTAPDTKADTTGA